MSFALFFALAVHCGFSTKDVLILQKSGGSCAEIERGVFQQITGLSFVVSDNLGIYRKVKSNWSLQNKSRTRTINIDSTSLTRPFILSSDSVYAGSVVSDQHDVYYIFDLRRGLRKFVERAILDFQEIAAKKVITDPETLFTDLYDFSAARIGKPMTENGITAVEVARNGGQDITRNFKFLSVTPGTLYLDFTGTNYIHFSEFQAEDNGNIEIVLDSPSIFKESIGTEHVVKSSKTIWLANKPKFLGYLDSFNEAEDVVKRVYIFYGVTPIEFEESIKRSRDFPESVNGIKLRINDIERGDVRQHPLEGNGYTGGVRQDFEMVSKRLADPLIFFFFENNY